MGAALEAIPDNLSTDPWPQVPPQLPGGEQLGGRSPLPAGDTRDECNFDFVRPGRRRRARRGWRTEANPKDHMGRGVRTRHNGPKGSTPKCFNRQCRPGYASW